MGDALSKYLGQTLSPFFIVFLRYFSAGLLALSVARLRGVRLDFPRAERLGIVLRTALVIGAMTLLILALSLIPLANAVGGFLIAPIIATMVSVVVYRERLTLPRITGAAVSFLGALLILKPGAEFEIGMVFALAGGALLGLFLATTRSAGPTGHPVSALAIQCLLGALMLLPLALPEFGQFGLAILLPAAGLGMITAATHFLTVAAYQRAEAAKLAPFFYFNLVAAVIVGVVWFQEIPGWLTVIGLVCILLGGLLSLIRPTQMERGLRLLIPPRPRSRDSFL